MKKNELVEEMLAEMNTSIAAMEQAIAQAAKETVWTGKEMPPDAGFALDDAKHYLNRAQKEVRKTKRWEFGIALDFGHFKERERTFWTCQKKKRRVNKAAAV